MIIHKFSEGNNTILSQFIKNRTSIVSLCKKQNSFNVKFNNLQIRNLYKSDVQKFGNYFIKNSTQKLQTNIKSSTKYTGIKRPLSSQNTNFFYNNHIFKRPFSFSTKKSSSDTVNINNVEDQSEKLPRITSPTVGYWLILVSGLVFGIVTLGGLTRLTESGLSITEWKPVTGSIPPITQDDWEKEFAKYKESPEFKLLNSNMDLDQFKFIFYMEWAHRLWGRAIGLLFVAPALYFAVRGRMTRTVGLKVAGISALIGFQGFIGWWMVKSGLKDDFLNEPHAHPRVSQYRLAAHLGLAFVIYSAMLSVGLGIIRDSKWLKNPFRADATIQQLKNPALKPFKMYSLALFGLVFLTAMSGAFVAGLDAGLIYNEFPYMGKGIFPHTNDLFDTFYSRKEDHSDLYWRNMLENPVTAQFDHRVLAVSTFVAVFALHLYSIKLKKRPGFPVAPNSIAGIFKKGVILPIMPKHIFLTGAAAMGLVSLQVTLGICTLLYLVPIPLAAAHQAGSLALLTSLILLCSQLKRPSKTIQILIKHLAEKARANMLAKNIH